MLRAVPSWAVPPPVLSPPGKAATVDPSIPPYRCSETWVVTVAVNIRRDPSFRRNPIGSFDEGVAIRVQRRGYFKGLQWVQLQVPLAGYREAWVLIKNGAGTRFLRPSTAEERGQQMNPPEVHKEPDEDREIDPITMEPIRPGEAFHMARPDGSSISYDPSSLIDYLLSSNDFTDPVTRLALTDEDLSRLDDLGRTLRLGRPSVLKAKREPNEGQIKNDKFKRDALLGLDRCAGELVCEMLCQVEECDDLEDGMLKLAMEIFPAFADIFSQLRAADRSYAKQCLECYLDFVRGPPNRRTRDRRGLLRPILSFLCDFT